MWSTRIIEVFSADGDDAADAGDADGEGDGGGDAGDAEAGFVVVVVAVHVALENKPEKGEVAVSRMSEMVVMSLPRNSPSAAAAVYADPVPLAPFPGSRSSSSS